MVKAAVKADLIFDFGVFSKGVDDGLNAGDVVVDGLFAKDVFARGDSLKGDFGVCVGGGTDEDGGYGFIG